MPGGGRRVQARPAGVVRQVLLALLAAAVMAARAQPLALDVAAPDAAHVAWLSAQRLQAQARTRGVELRPRLVAAPASAPGLAVLPLHELARQVPALDVLALPYFYADLGAVHRAVDGATGQALRAAARDRGWELLAVWDEGLHVLSGNLAYTHPRTLSGAEFVLLREDAIGEREFRALDAWTRPARPASLPQLQKECLVSSRSATAQQIAREQLQRVHLDLTLSRHRYEGWAVAVPLAAWRALAPRQRQSIEAAVAALRTEQRRLAAAEEQRALQTLRQDGMTLHALAPERWRSYRALQPAWQDLRSGTPDDTLWRRLLGGAAAAAGLGGDDGGSPARAQTQRRAP